MQKKAGLIIGAIVIVVVLATFFLTQSSKISKPSSQTSDGLQKSEESDSLESMTKGSIAGLLSAGKNVSCTMSYPDGKGSGSVYVSGRKMRGDFTVMIDATQEYKSSMIQDGEYAYTWSDVDKKGTKFKITDIKAPSPVPGTQSQSVDIDKEVDLKCSSLGVDPSKFVVPTDVEFKDMSVMMEKL